MRPCGGGMDLRQRLEDGAQQQRVAHDTLHRLDQERAQVGVGGHGAASRVEEEVRAAKQVADGEGSVAVAVLEVVLEQIVPRDESLADGSGHGRRATGLQGRYQLDRHRVDGFDVSEGPRKLLLSKRLHAP